MKNVIIYTRVSTDDQALNGFSLPHQLKTLTDYCTLLGYNLIKHFQDDFSAKTFERPEYLKLEQYCKANKKDVDLILFTRWDRFSRQCEFALSKIRMFQKIGIEVNSLEQKVDYSALEHKILLSIYLSSPESENDKISLRTIEGSRRARIEGCWTGPPFGYNNHRVGNKSTLELNEKAELVLKAFKLLSTGLRNSEAIRKELYKEGLKLHKQAFLNLIRNITYTGKILVKEWKKEEMEIVEGLHPAIISEDLFFHVQRVLDKRNRLKDKIKIQNEHFPLRGHLECKVCGGNLTASASTSRNKDRHFYYHCQKGCKERFRADEANHAFEEYLTSLQFPEELEELYTFIVKDVFSSRSGDKENQIKKFREDIAKNQVLLESTEDKFISNQINDVQYKSISNRYKSVIRERMSRRTNSIFLLYKSIKTDLVSIESKKASISTGLSTMAPEAGLEPATL